MSFKSRDEYNAYGSLGPSIEHTIMNHPTVVDLLLSFAHAAVSVPNNRMDVPLMLQWVSLSDDSSGSLQYRSPHGVRHCRISTARHAVRDGHAACTGVAH